jgi:hypothetical protein
MSLTHEVRGSLAKCLATENIIVEHKNVHTAMFDVDKRIPLHHSPHKYLKTHTAGNYLYQCLGI